MTSALCLLLLWMSVSEATCDAGSGRCQENTWDIGSPVSPSCSQVFKRASKSDLAGSGILEGLTEPVIVEGAAERIITDPRDWERENFLATLGGMAVLPRLPSEVAQFGPEVDSTMWTPSAINVSTFVRRMRSHPNEPGNVFVSASENTALLDKVNSMKRPDVAAYLFGNQIKRDEHMTLLSLSGIGNGLPMHLHGAAWLLQLGGAKRWYVYPSWFNV